jgi:hypothetical protein
MGETKSTKHKVLEALAEGAPLTEIAASAVVAVVDTPGVRDQILVAIVEAAAAPSTPAPTKSTPPA